MGLNRVLHEYDGVTELREELRLEDENRASSGDPEVLQTLGFLGFALTDAGDWKAIDALLTDMEARRARLSGESEQRALLGVILSLETRSLQGQGRFEEALTPILQRIAELESHTPLGAQPTRVWFSSTRVRADLLGSLERYDEELAVLESRPPGAPSTPVPEEEAKYRQAFRAEALLGLGRKDEATALLEALDWAWLDTRLLGADRRRLEGIAARAGFSPPSAFSRNPHADVDR